MFPGIDGFHWTVGHVLFLMLFFAVALTILWNGCFRSVAHRARLSESSSNRFVLES